MFAETMNDRIILLGVSILIANLFVLFAGVYNFNYYIFDAVIIAGIVIGLAGAFAPKAKRQVEATSSSASY